MSKLTPPLSAIEDRLFDPSAALIQRWITDDPALSAEERHALESDERAGFLRDLDLQARESAAATSAQGAQFPIDEATPVPARIAELHQRHVMTRDRFASIHEPAPGQIRLIARAIGPEGALDWDLSTPLAVLLWRPTEVRDLWEGWLMASETDYAADLDILLEPQDEPYDGQVAMVQIWNKLECYVHPEQRVIGQLAPVRLRAMVAAFADYALSEDVAAGASAVPACPGTLIERLTSTSDQVLCGTPLGDARDERRWYQHLYYRAAGLVKELAGLAVAVQVEEAARDSAESAATWLQETWGALVGGLQGLADELGSALIPVRPVAAMGQDETAVLPEAGLASTYQIPDLLQVDCLPHEVAGVVKLRLTRLAEGPVRLCLLLDEDTLEERTLDDRQSEATLFITPEPGLVLLVQDPHGGQHRWNLTI